MSFWELLRSRLAPEKRTEPLPLDVLEAHLEAFLDRTRAAEAGERAAVPSARGVPLPVLEPLPRRVVAVESGLSRIEVSRVEAGLRVHLLGDAFLPGWVELNERKQALLSELGIEQATSGHFEFDWRIDEGAGLRGLARRIETLLVRVLDREEGGFYSIAIEPERVLDNADIIESIQKLVKAHDLDSRRLLYQAFLNGRVVVPVELGTGSEALLVRPWKSDGAGTEWAVFTDEEALSRGQSTLGGVAIAMSGIRVVRAAEAAGIVALKLNPRSRVGGEFLRNELQMMCDYLRKIGVWE